MHGPIAFRVCGLYGGKSLVTASDWLPDWLNTYVVFCSQDYVTSALKLSELGAKWDDQPAVLPE